jgi:hypothetical protein
MPPPHITFDLGHELKDGAGFIAPPAVKSERLHVNSQMGTSIVAEWATGAQPAGLYVLPFEYKWDTFAG